MPSITLGVPQVSEYHPSYSGYVKKAESFSDPIASLKTQLTELLALLRPLSEEKQMHRYAEGKWTVKEVLGHLIDAERIFSYRALRFARNDQTPLAGFEENDYVAAAEANSCDWDELLDEFEHVRYATIRLLEHFPAPAWSRAGICNNHKLSVRALTYIMLGHVAHHLDIVRERYL